MASRLAAMLAQELAAQRTFLSSEEEGALTHPVSYDNEEDLAWDRVRGRKTWFFSALRDRFIRDGRRSAEWRELIRREEAEAGGETTYVSQLARQVLEWATRTSDRGAMMTGFAATAARMVGLLLALLGAWAYFNGGQTPGLMVGAFGALLVLAGGALGVAAKRRVRKLTDASWGPSRETAQPAAGT
ncbi:MAG TPA: hypothetical protein VFX49_12465 [Chloroflexota bacterium]|nr:hypothetical protein [Chloroflexota bacterium]